MSDPAPQPTPRGEIGGILDELVELVGLQSTLAIVERWGGIRLYVPEPRNLRSTHPLIETLGREHAETLAHHFQREEILIPRAASLVREIRDRRIRAEHDPDTGMSASLLARRWQLSLRQVRYILAAADDDGPASQVDSTQFDLL